MKKYISKLIPTFIIALGICGLSSCDSGNLNVALSEDAIDYVDGGSEGSYDINVVKQAGGSEVLSSKIYSQYGKAGDDYCLRFATAVKGDIESIEYTRAAIDSTYGEVTKEVTTIYKGIKSGSNVYYYDGTDLSTDVEYAGNYYWACYSIAFSSNTYKDTEITISIDIAGLDTQPAAVTTKLSTKLIDEIQFNTPQIVNLLQGEDYDFSGVATYMGSQANALKYMTAEDEDENGLTDNKFSSSAIGEHTITVTVEDTDNPGVSKSVDIDVNVARKIFGDTESGTVKLDGDTKYGTPSEQKATINDLENGGRYLLLNMEASRYYYAEANFTGSNIAGFMGYVHQSSKNDTNWLYTTLRPNEKGLVVGTNATGGLGERKMVANTDVVMGNTWNRSAETTKIATIRMDDTIYNFMNDQYIGSYVTSTYKDVGTIPGLYANGYGSGIDTVTLSNIDYGTGEQASTTKLNGLLVNGSKLINQGANRTDVTYDSSSNPTNWDGDGDIASSSQWGYWQPQLVEGTDFERVESDAPEKFAYTYKATGKNNTASLISPWVWFEGDFTFEFDYQFTSGTNNDAAMEVSVLSAENNSKTFASSPLEFGAKFGTTGYFRLDQELYSGDVSNNYANKITSVETGGIFSWTGDRPMTTNHKYCQPSFLDYQTVSWAGPTANADRQYDYANKPAHYKLERKVLVDGDTSNKYNQYTMTISFENAAGVEQVFSRQVTLASAPNAVTGGSGWQGINDEVSIQIKNHQAAGKYTNMTWSNEVVA